MFLLSNRGYKFANFFFLFSFFAWSDRQEQCSVCLDFSCWTGIDTKPSLYSAARLRGFEEDLHLEGEQFNTLLSIL